VRPPEWIAVTYFSYLAAAAVSGPFRHNRLRVALVSALVIVAIVVLAQADRLPWARVRDWMPGIYTVLGYWLPGLLVDGYQLRFERWLHSLDRAILPGIDEFARRAPRALLEYLELAYLGCYPLVPFGFLWLSIHGRVAEADRYWTVILLALYACYGVVPWLATRPPRAIEPTAAIDGRHLIFRAVNIAMLSRVSIQTNTCPSGHTAGALAAALVMATMMPLSGGAVAVLAISIAAASVIGRYHYAADALGGALVAIVAFWCGEWWLAAELP
jgi:membrane-associated phospholipid phosphatase